MFRSFREVLRETKYDRDSGQEGNKTNELLSEQLGLDIVPE